ncbi:MAG: RdgB/HAM1 family non-canonical purine NTP pyrophosphatase [Oscillospiraceae bacterium]|nr:RdgB/HAM1 family non-canonical purine NTP pyrophosphatase [Oscillospiraceae bacterium]
MNEFILATANPGKVAEMQKILGDLSISFVTRDDFGITIDVEETGTTFLENATLKAKAICKASGLPAIADDSGLIVDALSGEPGLYSSSYGGEQLTNEERYNFLLKKMKNMEHRAAKFVCTIVCAFPSGELLTATGECLGTILEKPRGSGGFGYDPVFLPDGFEKSMAELTADEKNKISHRAVALFNFAELLKSHTTLKGTLQ